ncbi:MAG: substrate-binding domain-containing protein [Acetobacteraceae bacterium]|nr:substrate-binding domain-containing protein [Acetobacteraceae bacterium]
MTLNKFTLLAASAAVSAFGAGTAQAQLAFPAATIVGAGASLPQNVSRQAGDCYGIKNDLGFGVTSGTPEAAKSLIDFDFDTPAIDTLANRFNCAVRDVQPSITTRYLSTGSGQGVTAYLNNRLSSTVVASPTFAIYTSGDGYQYSFSDTALSATNLSTYNTALINPFTRYGAAAKAADLFGAPIQIPVVLAAIAVGYSPVYAKVRLADTTVQTFTFKTPVAGLKLTRAQYCGIFNGTITNWNQLPTTVVNKDLADTAPFNVPIRLVGRSETSGTTSIYTRAMAAQCTGLLVATGVGGTGTPVAIVNKFGNSENRLPYDGVTTVTGTAYTGAAGAVSATNSLSGAFFNKGTGLITIGTEATGLFTVANGNDGVALATAYHPDPSATVGDRTQNGRINYVSPEQTLPAVTFNGANTLGLKSALLQVAATTTFVAPSASQAALAFGSIAPPQSKGTAGAYCTDAVACPAAYGDRSNPLDWVAPADKAALVANPAKGYPMVGTSNALLYTCYATPARRQGVAGFFATLIGKTPKDSLNQAMPAALVTDGVNGIFSKNGLGALPASWRTAIAETFFKSSAQLGKVGDATSKLGLRNLWIQDKIPTTPTGAGSVTAANSLCATKPGA